MGTNSIVDLEGDCEEICEHAAENAGQNGPSCTAELLLFHQCIESLECDQIYSWYFEEPDAQCLLEEAAALAACPGILLR